MYPRSRLPRSADQVPSQSLGVLQRIRKAYLCNFTHGDLPNNQWITPQGDHTLENVKQGTILLVCPQKWPPVHALVIARAAIQPHRRQARVHTEVYATARKHPLSLARLAKYVSATHTPTNADQAPSRNLNGRQRSSKRRIRALGDIPISE